MIKIKPVKRSVLLKKEIEYLENELKQWERLKKDFENDYKNPYFKDLKGSIAIDIEQCKGNIRIKKEKIKQIKLAYNNEIKNLDFKLGTF